MSVHELSWLIGPSSMVTCGPRWARRAPEGLVARLGTNCIGFVGEVFDGKQPFTPGGCVAHAWGVAELLRCLLRTEQTA